MMEVQVAGNLCTRHGHVGDMYQYQAGNERQAGSLLCLIAIFIAFDAEKELL